MLSAAFSCFHAMALGSDSELSELSSLAVETRRREEDT